MLIPKKKKKHKPKSPNHISWSKFRLTLTCDSSLQIHIHTNQTSVFQPIKQTNKKRPLQQWKPLFVLCNSEVWKSLFVLCNNRRFRSYTVSVLQQQIIQKVGIFLPFLVSYSITISRVLRITLECRFIDDFSKTKIGLVL